jgi:hypothetical protein
MVYRLWTYAALAVALWDNAHCIHTAYHGSEISPLFLAAYDGVVHGNAYKHFTFTDALLYVYSGRTKRA